MAVVIPPPSGLRETARILLDLADHPRDVRTVQAGNAFEVPDVLADAYNEYLAQPAPTGKRRGRAPRAVKED